MPNLTDHATPFKIDAWKLEMLYDCEKRSNAAVEIVTADTVDTLGRPVPGGVYDLAFGPFDRGDVCGTCEMTDLNCPGHVGFVSLPVPVYNPLLFDTVLQLLKATCMKCCKLFANKALLAGFYLKLEVLEVTKSCLAVEEFDSRIIGYQQKYKQSPESGVQFLTEVRDYLLDKYPNAKQVPSTRYYYKMKRMILSNFQKGVLNEKHPLCPHCGVPSYALKSSKKERIFAIQPTSLKAAAKYDRELNAGKSASNVMVTPLQVWRLFRAVWAADEAYRKSMQAYVAVLQRPPPTYSDACPVDLLFMCSLLVTPTKYRPQRFMSDGKTDNSKSVLYKRIMEDCISLKRLIAAHEAESVNAKEADATKQSIMNTWSSLQANVNNLYDKSFTKAPMNVACNGVKQLVEKKAGIIRQNMMGKRINFAGRTVITPDFNIDMDEVGVPQVFALKLTYPAYVNEHNIDELRELVIRGPNEYPGAVFIEEENGQRIMIPGQDRERRIALAKQLDCPGRAAMFNPSIPVVKAVHRHMRDGDYVIMNRQPSLHKPSMQAHRARVLPGKTLRMHYANCKGYNADFDGDEMNVHFPQSEMARAECYSLMAVPNNMLVPKDGSPLSGLIQDHIVGGSSLTLRDMFMTRDKFQQLLAVALGAKFPHLACPPPAVWKPKMLWTGKQLVSTIVRFIMPPDAPPLTYISSSKVTETSFGISASKPEVSAKYGLNDPRFREEHVVFLSGQMLSGILDKSQIGASKNGLIYYVNAFCGGRTAVQLISSIARLCSAVQHIRPLTVSIEDVLLNSNADRARRKHMKKIDKRGRQALITALGFEDECDVSDADVRNLWRRTHFSPLQADRGNVDTAVKRVMNEIQNSVVSDCLPRGLVCRFPSNGMEMMIETGAKGSKVNGMQMYCVMGQIDIDGKRPRLMSSGKSLPGFLPYATEPRAQGFVSDRFSTGLRPQEYFFHCAAGRKGLVDTAVKTSRSGYLQRCVVKNLESLRVAYDHTVRDSADDTVVQFLFGEDGLDVIKAKSVDSAEMLRTVLKTPSKTNRQALQQLVETTDEKMWSDIWRIEDKITQIKKNKTRFSSAFTEYSKTEQLVHSADLLMDGHMSQGRPWSYWALKDKWFGLSTEKRTKLIESANKKKMPDPVISRWAPGSCLGVASEKFYDNAMAVCDQMYQGGSEDHDDGYQLLLSKYMQALVDPGDMVGIVCAQSIGEPSTQMTLNTFHFAGQSDMNVTLGIPRLREVLMTASATIKTPMMEVPILPDKMDAANKLQKRLNRVLLKQVVHLFEVEQTQPLSSIDAEQFDFYRIHVKLLPKRLYKDVIRIKPEMILRRIERLFFRSFNATVYKFIKTVAKGNDVSDDVVKMLRPFQVVIDGDAPLRKRRGEDDDDYAGETDEVNEILDIDDDVTGASALVADDDSSDDDDEDDTSDSKDTGDDAVGKTSSRSKQAGDKDDENSMDIDGIPETSTKSSKRELSVFESAPQLIASYEYDSVHNRWFTAVIKLPSQQYFDLKDIVQAEIDKFVIQSVAGIKRAFVDETNKTLTVEGVNLPEMFRHRDCLDVSKIHTNDIQLLTRTMGIEAGRNALVREVRAVFAAYGIAVDYRHLSLLADYMAITGGILPLSRNGMIRDHASPLTRMTFETSMAFLTRALLHGETDNMTSPSANIMIGQPAPIGTGYPQLLYDRRTLLKSTSTA